jgi:MFS family permease
VARTDETLWQSVRALPRPVWVLFAGSFVNRFGSFVATFLVLYLVERGFSAASAGLAVSAYGVGSLASALVGGWLADRIGGRAAIATSMFSAAAVALALSQADRLASVVVLAGLFGMSTELYRPASAALLADLVSPERRLAAYAGYRLAINAGFAFGPAVAGLLAERSFLWLFVGEAATSVVLGVVALAGLPSVRRSPRTDESPGEAIRALRADPRFVVFLVASVLAAAVYFQSTAALPLHVRQAGLSRAVYGGLISLNGLLIVLLEFPLVGVTRRFRAGPTMAVGVVITGVGFALTGAAHSVALLITTVVVWTLGEMIAAPVMNTYVAAVAPRHLRGRYQGAYVLTSSVALALAPAIGTRVFALSPAALWLGCGVVGVIAALLMVRSAGDPSEPRTSRPHGS